MAVIVDTSVWVDIERQVLDPQAVVQRIGNEAVLMTPMVWAELMYGVARAASAVQRDRRQAAVDRLRRTPCLDANRDTAEIFARIAAQLDSAGRPSTHRTHDLWIGALALQYGHRVLTRNAADFGDIPGLDVVAI